MTLPSGSWPRTANSVGCCSQNLALSYQNVRPVTNANLASRSKRFEDSEVIGLDISDSLVRVAAGDDQHREGYEKVFKCLPVILGEFRHTPDDTVLSAGVFDPCPI
jgi:hypothetical protein